MFRRTVSGIMLTLILTNVLALAFNIQPVATEPSLLTVPEKSAAMQGTINLASQEPPPTEWNRTYGGEDLDVAVAVVQTADGGYALAGITDTSGVNGYDALLVKTDSAGIIQWNMTYGGTEYDVAYALVQTSDGGYALAGSTGSYGATGSWFWLVKTDLSGNAQWNKTYGGIYPGNDGAYALVQTADGGYVLAGYTDSKGGGDFWLVKTNAIGNAQWNKSYGGVSQDWAYALVQTSDGGYALAGHTSSYGAGNDDVWLVKTDSAGNGQWNKTYGGTNKDIAEALVQTTDSRYLLAGYTKSQGAGVGDFWLVKTDSNGNVQWNKTYGGPAVDEAHALVQTSDGGYALAGATGSYGANGDFWLVKIAPEPSASATIYIRTDGSIDPPTAPIQHDGDIYTITGDIASDADGIVVERSNITIDGAGYTLQGSGSGYGFSMAYRVNVTIKHTNIKNFNYGIDLRYSSSNIIFGNNMTANNRGISLSLWSNYNNMSGNSMADNGAGIYAHNSNYNSIFGNNVTASSYYGIGLDYYSSYNSIFGNNVTASSYYGILLSASSVNNIVGNIIIASSYYGIYSISSSDNSISGNSIANNVYGMWLGSSSYNLIYHNNFNNNLEHALISGGNGNVWDDGYPSGGNYWSDYTGVDSYSGPNQDQPGSDDILDHPYAIDENNTDHYPLVNPWTPIPPSQPPNCVVRLQKDGIEIAEIGVEQFFDIYVGASSDDTGIIQVRFLTNDIRDSPPTGSWTEWYEWDTSSGDWNALEKNMDWAFGTPGYKEVWAEIRDNALQTDRSCADIYVPGSQPPICNVRLRRSGTQITEVDQGKPIEIYVGDSTDDAAIATVMFSSDDLQDDSPTGEWTEIFDWDSNRGEWYAGGKTMEWSFSTPGKKEVWALITDSDGNSEWNHVDILVHPGYAIIVAGEGGWKEQWGIDAAADNAYRALQSLGFDDDHIVYLNSRFPRDVDSDSTDEVDGYAARSYFEDALQDIRNEIAGYPTPLVLYLTGHGDPVNDNKVGFYFGNWVYPDDYLFNDELSQLLNEFSHETPMLIVLGCCYSGVFITSSNSISGPNRIMITAAQEGKRNYIGWLQSSDRFFGNLKNGLNVKDAFTARALWGDNHNMWLDDNGDRVGHPPNDLQNDGTLSANTRVGYLSAENMALMPWESYKLCSPGEIYIHDSMNRTTGMVNGELKEEIPNSFYDEESSTVVIFWPSDSYFCHVVGNETGTYGLDIVHIEDGSATTFSAFGIATSSNATHLYSVDWAALSQGGDGAIIQVDLNGDGVFEYDFTSDSELSRIEYVAATAQHDLGITGITSSRSVTGEGYTLPINMTTMNYGVYTETFNVSFYVNTTLVGSQTVVLASGNSTTITFPWNTTGFAYGNYTISAHAEPVLDETYVADNNATCIAPVHVGVPGDVTGPTVGFYDGTTNMRDIQYLILLFNTNPSSPNWKPNADVNNDATVNMRDIQIAILNFNKHE
jgi:parallel beta-helix repeat protein